MAHSAVKELKAILKEFDHRDPIGSLNHFYNFISDAENHFKLRTIHDPHQRIAAVSGSIPADVRATIERTSHTFTDPDAWERWKDALEQAYFPPNPSLWHEALNDIKWDGKRTRFGIHVNTMERLAHRAGVINMDLADGFLPAQLTNPSLWHYFIKSVPEYIRTMFTILGIDNLSMLTEDLITRIERNVNSVMTNKTATTSSILERPATTDGPVDRLAALENAVDRLAISFAAIHTNEPRNLPNAQHIRAPPASAQNTNMDGQPPFLGSGCGWCGNPSHATQHHLDGRYFLGGPRYRQHYSSFLQNNNGPTAPNNINIQRQNTNFNNNHTRNGNGERPTDAGTTCFLCHDPGHRVRDCPEVVAFNNFRRHQRDETIINIHPRPRQAPAHPPAANANQAGQQGNV